MSTARANGAFAAGPGPYGELQEADDNGIMLPPGFSSRVIANSAQPVAGSDYVWHPWPDGGACFAYGGNYVYVSNSEIPIIPEGGVGGIFFDGHGNILDAYEILFGSTQNCAGGATLWNTWLSCEEHPSGRVFECDPLGIKPPRRRRAMGWFAHEAVAQDPDDPARFYMTEDQPDSGFYRFTSDVVGDLSSGLLEIAELYDDGSGEPGDRVRWHEVPIPRPGGAGVQTRHQVDETTHFNGGEGITYAGRKFLFATKGDDRIWSYVPATERLCLYYDAVADPSGMLGGVDNLTSSRSGDVYVAEDGDNMEMVLLSKEGTVSPLLRVLGQNHSEIAGPAFDPYQRRLYFSSQRGGPINAGITYEIKGPFRNGNNACG